MKTFSNLLLRLFATLLPLSFIVFTSCSSSDEELPAIASVVAKFDYELSNEGVAPSTVTFTNTSIAATSYVWNFGIEGETSTDENPEFTYEEFGTFDVTLIARADDDRADTTTQTIVIKDPLGGKKPTLYYTDRATGQIHMIILDDDAETPIVQTFGEKHTKPYGIAADLDNENLYVVDQEDELMYQYDALVKGEKSVILNVADLGDDAYMMYYPAGVKVIEGRLYWGAEGGIYTSALDGSDLKPFVEFSTANGAFEGSLPLGISYDAENQVIYFANDAYDFGGGVYKVNLDGTGLEEIIPEVDAGDISYLDGKLYYFDFITAKGTIYEIASKTKTEFVDYPQEFVWGTIADPITKRVYWTDRGTNDDGTDGKIMSANLDGSDIKVVLDIDNIPAVDDVKILRPYALALGLF
ncbi:PKD domain-containing protein [Flammeovirga sp. OC4]|uniref:PKD domain-containing protein n=1 Tax=Flammeovirga sp. OC4 TaxID=1382345 RepID=UPI0005C4963F|nr:PKD domain-containing protein [Flammeovirga sp. OC4]